MHREEVESTRTLERSQWATPESVALSSVEEFVNETRRKEAITPLSIGFGTISNPIKDCSLVSLLAEEQLAVKEPWHALFALPQAQ